jgi:hypothetical protein
MKKIISFLVFFFISFTWVNVQAYYSSEYNNDPIFMENVYNFINTADITDWVQLSYCEEVYLEATRRRDYTQYELEICWEYFTQKNNEEKAYMQYMFNNRELFY